MVGRQVTSLQANVTQLGAQLADARAAASGGPGGGEVVEAARFRQVEAAAREAAADLATAQEVRPTPTCAAWLLYLPLAAPARTPGLPFTLRTCP